jgi:hypothetical protein
LGKHRFLKAADSVFKIVEKFYPPERILPKTRFLIEELLGNIQPPP